MVAAAGGARAAHERKKALKKALPEDVGADALRGPPCSAHLSGYLMTSP